MREMGIERLKPHRDEMPLDVAIEVVRVARDFAAYSSGPARREDTAVSDARELVALSLYVECRGASTPAARAILGAYESARKET